MEIRQLRAFVEIARHGHVTRAAQHLLMAQPALSQQLRRLEREAGSELFVRNAKGVALTAAGEQLLPHARRILTEHDDALAGLAGLRGLSTGRLRLGATQWPGPVDLAALVATYHQAHPGIEIVLRESTESLPALVLADEIDLALAVLPERLDPRLRSTVLAEEDLVVVLPLDHGLAARREVDVSHLDGESLIAFRAGSALAELTRSALLNAGVDVRSTVESSNPETITRLVAAGLGVALLPPAAVPAAHANRVAVCTLGPMGPRRTIGLVHRRDRRPSPATRAFLQIVTPPSPTALVPATRSGVAPT